MFTPKPLGTADSPRRWPSRPGSVWAKPSLAMCMAITQTSSAFRKHLSTCIALLRQQVGESGAQGGAAYSVPNRYTLDVPCSSVDIEHEQDDLGDHICERRPLDA